MPQARRGALLRINNRTISAFFRLVRVFASSLASLWLARAAVSVLVPQKRCCKLYFSMSDPAPVRVRGLHERTEDNNFEGMTPADRIGMMWQLALDVWADRGPGDADSTGPREIVRIQRGRR